MQIPRAACPGWAGRLQQLTLPQTPLSTSWLRGEGSPELPQPWPPPWPAWGRAVQPWQNHSHFNTEIVSVMLNQSLATYWSHKASQDISATGAEASQTSQPCTPRPWPCSRAPCLSVHLSVLQRLVGHRSACVLPQQMLQTPCQMNGTRNWKLLFLFWNYNSISKWGVLWFT